MNFCEECNKIVPDSEVKDIFDDGHKRHIYKKTVNANRNVQPGMIGCCLVSETVWCGNIREPNAQEYFIYHTLNIDSTK
jgi:hypothetical protein